MKSSASSQHDGRRERTSETMSKKAVSYEIDPAKPPPIRAKEKAEIAALLARPDSEIDISDIPPLTKKFWKNAVRNPYCKPTKP